MSTDEIEPKPPETWAEARPHVVPRMLRSTDLLAGAEELLHWRLASDLLATVVLDSPHHMLYLDARLVQHWGVSEAEIMEVACANLLRLSILPFRLLAPGLFGSPWQDQYDASRLLLKPVIQELPVLGRPVVLAPHRDLLLVTGSDDPAGLAAMLEVARAESERPYGLSRMPVVLEAEKWVDYHPLGSPDWDRYLDEYLSQEYAEQSGLLEARFEAEGTDIFVGSRTRISSQDGSHTTTLTSWGEGIDSLLPVADWLLVGNPESMELRAFRWSVALEHFAHCLEPHPNLFPKRYRTVGFPNEAELARVPYTELEHLMD
jgi:hypothetical protein